MSPRRNGSLPGDIERLPAYGATPGDVGQVMTPGAVSGAVPVRILVARHNTITDKAEVVFREAGRYAQTYGLTPPGGALAAGLHGKPYFSGGGPGFSISHSGDYWVCAIYDGPVGVDVQRHQRCAARTIARRHFHPEEYAWLENVGFSRFYDLWAARESYVKFTGSGIDDDFGDICITEKTPGLFRTGDAWIYLVKFLDGYSLCVCCGEAAELEPEGLRAI